MKYGVLEYGVRSTKYGVPSTDTEYGVESALNGGGMEYLIRARCLLLGSVLRTWYSVLL
jgi:hypothetical protein